MMIYITIQNKTFTILKVEPAIFVSFSRASLMKKKKLLFVARETDQNND